MSVNIKTTLQTAANKVGIDESAANNIANWLIDQGYEMSKPTKPENKPDQKAIEEAEAARARQSGSAESTPADVAANQLRVQPKPETDATK
jgi:hypothetical protein